MITCPSCREPAPPQALEPRFCYSCGKPVSQVCPYEEGTEATRLPLFSDARAPSSCGGCGGLLKRCSQCFRLYRLDDAACQTPDCLGVLLEATRMFPIAGEGALDGTHAMECPQEFAASFTRVAGVQDSDELQKLAYRYGLLAGVSRRDLLAFTWNGTAWEPRNPGRVALVPSGDVTVKSLILDEGLAFALAEDRAVVVRLAEMQIQESFLGRFALQSKSDLGWFRIPETPPGQNTALLVTDCRTWQTQTIALPVSSADITAITAVEPVVVATRTGLLLQIHVDTGQAARLPETGMDWRRLAVFNGDLVALGFNPNREPHLLMLRQGQAEGPFRLQEGVHANFAWVGDDLYLASGNQILTATTQPLSQRPRQIALRGGQETQEELTALYNAQGQRRLLIRRRSGSMNFLYLVNPQSGEALPLGSESLSPPQVVVTGEMAVIATREGAGSKLRTYALGEHS